MRTVILLLIISYANSLSFFNEDTLSYEKVPSEKVMDWRLSFNIVNSVPQNEFQDNYQSSALGWDIALAYGIGNSPASVGLDFNMLFFDPFNSIEFNDETYEAANRLYMINLPVRFSPRLPITENFAFTPFFEVLGSYMIYDSRIQFNPRDNHFDDVDVTDVTIDNELNSSWGWGFGVGYTLELVSGSSGDHSGRLNLETKLRYISGQETTYYKVTVFDENYPDGEFTEYRSRTEQITFHIGISIEFE